MRRERITGRYIICGELHLESPLLIGTGEKTNLEIQILKDGKGNPYIPASSMNGVLRHYFYKNTVFDEVDQEQLDFFWGSHKQSKDENIYQSAFILQDLPIINTAKIIIRDGVSIDSKKGIAEDEKKFAYEIVEPGAKFDFKAEIILRDCFSERIFLKTLATIVKALKDGEINVGSMTTKGFGRCRLKEHKTYKYAFVEKKKAAKDVLAWLERQTTKEQKDQPDQLFDLDLRTGFLSRKDDLILNAIFGIKSSLIVRAYSGLPQETDATHITSAGKNVIPGTSIKGALGARAKKIVNTLSAGRCEMTRQLFGWASDKKANNKEKYKSRFIVEEAYINDAVKETQYRTKIDRFTGGVIGTGLFDSTPVWSDGENTQVAFNIKVNECKDWEAGLVLLILKDLWTGDLPLGGEKSIGRGTLKGISAKVSFKGQDYIIKASDTNNVNIDGEKSGLERLVQTFVKKCCAEEVVI